MRLLTILTCSREVTLEHRCTIPIYYHLVVQDEYSVIPIFYLIKSGMYITESKYTSLIKYINEIK